MSPTRLLLFVLFLSGLFHVYLLYSRDPGLSDNLVAAEIRNNAGFSHIATGAQHSCAIGAMGGVWCWGQGEAGQLGHGRFTPSATPVPVVGLPGQAVHVSVGIATSCAILRDTTLWCWGSSAYGQIGLPEHTPATAHPQPIKGLEQVRDVALGHAHICATQKGGALSCWGDTRVERDGGVFIERHTSPRRLPEAPVLDVLSAGDWHTCGRSRAGEVYCWGGADDGALGQENGRKRRALATPTVMPLPHPARDLSAGGAHSCALDVEDGLRCWGHSSNYAAPSDHNTDISPDFLALTAPAARGLATGWNTSCVLEDTGKTLCLGGDTSTPWRPFSPDTPGLRTISAQGLALCGLDKEGSAWCTSLSHDHATPDMPPLRPSSWQADNSFSARWHRMVGLWARRTLPTYAGSR